MDNRIIQDFLERKGKIIDGQAEVGGYPKYSATHRKLVIPDGDIESWLRKFAFELE